MSKIKDNFKGLGIFLGDLDTEHYCDLISQNKVFIESNRNRMKVDCETKYHNLLKAGLENTLHVFAMELFVIHRKFLNYLDTKDLKSAKDLIDNEKLLSLLDISSMYVNDGTHLIIERVESFGMALFKEASNFDTADFIAFSVILTLMFMVALRWFLNSFRLSLWKVKRMLGILPTKNIAGQLDEIKALIKQIS